MTLREYLAAYEAAHRHPLNQLTHVIGIPLIVASLPLLVLAPRWGLGLFVGGWALQFLGHRLEGNAPKFFQGPVFLLIGALWVPYALAKALRSLKTPQAPRP